jgi:hypothetical protein
LRPSEQRRARGARQETPQQTEKLTYEADGEMWHQHSHATVDATAEETDVTDRTINTETSKSMTKKNKQTTEEALARCRKVDTSNSKQTEREPVYHSQGRAIPKALKTCSVLGRQ